MNTPLPVGRGVTVDVAASTANLGPGFDALGLALAWRDRMTLGVSAEPAFHLTGVGADAVPRDASHLVVRACLDALAALDASAPALTLTAHNTIPHGSGLGSSAAAVVAGAAAAWGLARPGVDPDPDWLLEQTFDAEGHGDNLAASIRGGAVLAWRDQAGPHAVSLPVHPDIAAVAYTTERSVATRSARGVLPARVPHADAAFNVGRGALLVHALAERPDLLFAATQDMLHQPYRAELMGDSWWLVETLRGQGFAAFVSGAGPTVVALGERAALAAAPEAAGFVRHALELAAGVTVRPDAWDPPTAAARTTGGTGR